MGEKSEDSEAYLKRRRIRELFQSLMAGILYHKPDDHVEFLIMCLTKLHQDPLAVFSVRWNTFIDAGTNLGGANGDPHGGLKPEQVNMQLQTFLSGAGYLY